ncbi:MAG: hypothetical protein ACD_10C00873G0001 [uncultured bacterium]|nr:MAG: hypothetical protein ACD_10C00873G0001 [uncultured bacterium]
MLARLSGGCALRGQGAVARVSPAGERKRRLRLRQLRLQVGNLRAILGHLGRIRRRIDDPDQLTLLHGIA